VLPVLRDCVRLRRRPDFIAGLKGEYASTITLIEKRPIALAEGDGTKDSGYDYPDARRLANRLSRHRGKIFTFPDPPDSD